MLPYCDWNVVDIATTRYKRTHNTSVAETEKRLNEIYGAWRTLLCNSGMEAIHTALDLVRPKTVIVDDETYFETQDWLRYQGYHVVKVRDINDLSALERGLRYNKESVPILIIFDHPSTFGRWYKVSEISELAHRFPHAYTMADNSICSLYYSSPIKMGADICVESYTKYVCGHGDVFAGGLALAESMIGFSYRPVPLECPGMDSVQWVAARRGNAVSPYTAYMVARGLETLAVRMNRHTASARYIYEILRQRNVECLYAGVGGLITLPGRGEDFCKRLKKFPNLGTFGMTYSNSDFFRSKERYPQGFCARLSVGLEDAHELLDDVLQALEEEKK